MKTKYWIYWMAPVWMVLCASEMNAQGGIQLQSQQIAKATLEEIFEFEFIRRMQNGAEGRYDSELYLGSAVISNGRALLGKKWFLWSDKPEIFCGKMERFGSRREKLFALLERGREMDWVIRMEPGTGFEHLIAHTYHKNLLAAEVTPHKDLFYNPWFAFDEKTSPLVGQTICACGTYVRDKEHDRFGPKMEIHPTHLLWWEASRSPGSRTLQCIAIQDHSHRFNRNLKRQGMPASMRRQIKPWVVSPLEAHIRLAFTTPPAGHGDPVAIALTSQQRRDVHPAPAASADRDIYLDGHLIVRVTADDPPEALSVQFDGLRLREDGRLQGYVDITTMIGQAGTYGAYHLFQAEISGMPPEQINDFASEPCGEAAYLVWTRQMQVAHLHQLIAAHEAAMLHLRSKALRTLTLQRDLLREKSTRMDKSLAEAKHAWQQCMAK